MVVLSPIVMPKTEPTVDSAGDALGRLPWMALLAAFLGWLFDGFEMSLFSVVARPALKDMAGTAGDAFVGDWMGRITAGFLLGAALGGGVFGWLGDRVGRVRAMSLSILTYSLFSGAAYFAAVPWHLAGLRFLAALGMGGEWALGVALVMECWPEKYRPRLAGAIGAASNLGMVLVGVVAWWVPVTVQSWRWMFLVGAAPALLTLFIRCFVPESPRWQAAAGGPTRQPLAEIFGPALIGRTLIASALAAVALIGTWGSVQWIPLWADQLTGGTLPQAKATAQMASSLGAVGGSLLAPLLGGRCRRRHGYFTLCLLSLLVCGALFRGFTAFTGSFLAMVFLTGGCTAAFYGWLPLYLPELFPTRVRATGLGIAYNSGRILAAVGALASGQLVGLYHGNFGQMAAVITLVYLGGMGLVWLAPETGHKPLPV